MGALKGGTNLRGQFGFELIWTRTFAIHVKRLSFYYNVFRDVLEVGAALQLFNYVAWFVEKLGSDACLFGLEFFVGF